MDKKTKIFTAGHKGIVGSAVCRALESKGYSNLNVGRNKAKQKLS